MNKTNILHKGILLLLFMGLCLGFDVNAQTSSKTTVKGVVVDETNQPVIAATVTDRKTNAATVTDLNGNYSITVPSDATLEFSCLGLTTLNIKVNGRALINVQMSTDKTFIEESVVVGYGTQKRGSITGAVSAVKGQELIKTKNENPQNMLTGRIAGVRVWQKTAEPGSYNDNMDIRGMGTPLVVIDGIPRTMGEFQRLNANDIQDISVLKDASASIYGVRAANGVLLVTTKHGDEGSAKVSYNGSYTMQFPSQMPELCDAFETMTLYNEIAMNNVNGGSKVYTENDFQAYRDGTRKTTDWTSLIFSTMAPQTQHDVTISGGTSKVKYFVSMGYFYQQGFFKSGDLNYSKYNLHSNLDAEVARGLNFNLNVDGIVDDQDNPYCSSVDIIRNYWRQGVLFPAYADDANTMLNYEGLDLEENTVAKMTSSISGYRKYRDKYIQLSPSLTYDFGKLSDMLNGLKAKAMFSYDYHLSNNETYRKQYYQYAKNNQTGEYTQKLYADSSPNQLRREFYDKTQYLGQVTLNYERTFNERHKVGAMLGAEYQRNLGDNFYAQRNLAFAMPYLFAGVSEDQLGGMDSGSGTLYDTINAALIGRVNYSFSDRYLLEAQFRYDGSSKFAKGHQWGFFPSVSAGWRVSEEDFIKNNDALNWISQLKLRASYGVLGDDGDQEYDWAMGYTYPATGENEAGGFSTGYAPGWIFDNQFILGVSPLALPNLNTTWFTSKTMDLGFDFEAWDGLLGISYDYYDRYREGMFARKTGALPTVVGATAPRENLDSDKHMGMELEIKHRNKIGDFTYSLRGIVTITRQEYLTASGKGPYANSYDRWRNDNLTNRYQGVQFGYESNGRYANWDDIWNETLYHERDVLPGDYKYVDWNGDGEINSLDEHPYAYDQTPWLNYSLNGEFQWKGFDFSILFQGSALGSMAYREPLYSIWGKNGGGALKQYLDRWHPTDADADPYDPATSWIQGYYAYTGHSPYENSSFNRVSTAYLRLKSVEIGYTIPKLPNSSVGLRIYANAYNMLTFTGVKFVDPEHPDDELGRLYPLSKTVTLGMSFSF
jgi:TonB-linked SusC/RagA family outer membrane protein